MQRLWLPRSSHTIRRWYFVFDVAMNAGGGGGIALAVAVVLKSLMGLVEAVGTAWVLNFLALVVLAFIGLLVKLFYDYLRAANQTPLERLAEFVSFWGQDGGPLEGQLEFEYRRLEQLWRDACHQGRGTGLRLEAEALLHHWKARMACLQSDDAKARAHTGIQITLMETARKEHIRCARLELARVMRMFNVPEEIGRRVAQLVWSSTTQSRNRYIDQTPTLCKPDGTREWRWRDGFLRDWSPGWYDTPDDQLTEDQRCLRQSEM